MDIQKISYLTNNYVNTPSAFLYEQIRAEMLPAFYSFSRKLYFMEKEDCLQEFSLALFESLSHIKYAHNPYGTFKYLYRSIHNKYLALYTQNSFEPLKISLNECTLSSTENGIQVSEFYADFYNRYSQLSQNKKSILKLAAQGYSNTEISHVLGISRQYIHRIRKEVLHELL